MRNIKLPTDKEIQEWGDEYADEHNERSDNPLSPWWVESESFINGGRAVINYIQSQYKTKNLKDMTEEEIDEWIKIIPKI